MASHKEEAMSWTSHSLLTPIGIVLGEGNEPAHNCAIHLQLSKLFDGIENHRDQEEQEWIYHLHSAPLRDFS